MDTSVAHCGISVGNATSVVNHEVCVIQTSLVCIRVYICCASIVNYAVCVVV